MTTPVVSVLLPVRDAEAFLPAALASLAAQTFTAFEVLLVDDGSHDGSPGIMSAWAARDARFQVLPSPGRGLVEALNHAAAAARGSYLARMDADDIALPHRLALQVATLAARPELTVVGGQIRLLHADRLHRPLVALPTAPAAIARRLPHGNVLVHPAVVMRAAAFQRAGGYRAAFRDAEDYDLWLRMAEHGQLANLPEVVLHYRVHPGQLSGLRVRNMALATLGAQACSLARQRGAEPPLPAGLWDAAALLRLGIPDVAIRDALSDAPLARIIDLLAAGFAAPAAALIEDLARDGQPGNRRQHAGLVLCRWWLRRSAGYPGPTPAAVLGAMCTRPRLALMIFSARTHLADEAPPP